MTSENEQQEQLIYNFEAKDGSAVTLRPAMEKDAYDIITFAQSIVMSGSFIQKEQTKTPEQEIRFIQEMKKQGHMYTAVEVEGKVLGIARIIRGDLSMKRHTGVFRTWLTDDAQGKGIGKKIMEYTLEWAKREGLHKICLTVFSGNPNAQKLYERYGFVVEGTQKDQLLIGDTFQDEIYMAYFF
ncbi:GNAT family N-acetyltransferase [Alkalihalobacillus sp. AL-G]|uniref:GNAT family N-acetyltransferase n=1 Tax=Alkalihalobacillus sp. AL-G TaxID=2926399 RepID=UPI00272D6882|nr:GNAT family protein [Alkalihalobacillus sp. AL-G]WLD95287.1 GNAT family N-acetyltransferase [Alkalihalobacillus sp. AL-G]